MKKKPKVHKISLLRYFEKKDEQKKPVPFWVFEETGEAEGGLLTPSDKKLLPTHSL